MDDIIVRFWAAARAAAGVSELRVPAAQAGSVAQLIGTLVGSQPTRPADGRLGAILPLCAVLVDDQPLGGRDPAAVALSPGARVEFLPPFAGG